jgi:hypothetical protein
MDHLFEWTTIATTHCPCPHMAAGLALMVAHLYHHPQSQSLPSQSLYELGYGLWILIKCLRHKRHIRVEIYAEKYYKPITRRKRNIVLNSTLDSW